ncbi:MAG TPA: YoaK family protein [Solirubrobacterales bacterium]
MTKKLGALPDEDLHVLLVLALTVGTGAVDAVSYFSLDHTFTANMSGNMALLGIGIANGFGSVEGNVFAFVGFVLGSIAIGRFIHAHHGPFLRTAVEALVAELVILLGLTVLLGIVDVADQDFWRYAVCVLLAAAMGIQTGVGRHMSVKDVNTTVATMTLHDLAAASKLAGGDSVRWRRRAGVVVALLAGAAIGVGLDKAVSWGGLAFTSLVTVVVIGAAVALLRREPLVD